MLPLCGIIPHLGVDTIRFVFRRLVIIGRGDGRDNEDFPGSVISISPYIHVPGYMNLDTTRQMAAGQFPVLKGGRRGQYSDTPSLPTFTLTSWAVLLIPPFQ